MIVLDASAIIEYLLGTSRGDAVRDRIAEREQSLHAPHLLDVEAAHILRRYVLAGDLLNERGRDALRDLVDLDIRRYPHDVLLSRVWELRASITAHDAVYLALAEALDAPLVTADRRLASAPGHGAVILVIPG